MSISEQIVLVENALRDLIQEWGRFFAGDLRVPPQANHERINRRLRHLAGETIQRRGDQFRLENLQHRFTTYAANWTRMLREREEGRGRFAADGRPQPAPARPETNADATGSVSTPGNGNLYDRYVVAKRERGLEVNVSREQFEVQLASEQQKLETRLGHAVRFEVHVQDGKVKLAARKAGSASQEE
jgi:hypothetical protein